MPPKNVENASEQNRQKAIKAIEKIAASPETGAELIKQIDDAHEILEKAMEEVKSPEEELPLRIALKDIESLETVLAEKGKNRKLTVAEKKKLSSIAEVLKQKVEGLDFVMDFVKFSQDFDTMEGKYKADLKALNLQIGNDGLKPEFAKGATVAIASYESLSKYFYEFFEEANQAFGVDGVPQEIKTKLDEMQERLTALSEQNTELKNAIKFAEIEKEFLPYADGKKAKGMAPFVLRENLSKIAEKFEAVGVLDEKLDALKMEHLSFMKWNLQLLAGYNDEFDNINAENLSTSLHFLEGKKALEEAVHYSSEFDKNLSWLVAGVLSLAESAKDRLPTDTKFYKTLYALVAKRLERANEDEVLANGYVMLSQLAVLTANVEHAAVYKPGVEIWHKNKTQQPVRDHERSDKVGSSEEIAGGSWKESDNDIWKKLGIVESVDVFAASLKVKGLNNIFAFSELENDDYYFKSGEKTSESSVGQLVDSSGLEYYKNDAEKLMKRAEVLTLKSSIKNLNVDVKILDAHIPKVSLLRKFKEEGWVSLSKTGNIDISSTCPDEYITQVYQEILNQFNIEKIYQSEDALADLERTNPEKAKADPYFGSRKLFLQSQRELAGNQIYEAKGSLVRFLDSLKSIKGDKDEEIKAAEEFALASLKEFAGKSLQRLMEVANVLFSENPEHKSFKDKLIALVKSEFDKLEKSDDYKFDVGVLVQEHWREVTYADREGGSLETRNGRTLIDEEARKYAWKEAGEGKKYNAEGTAREVGNETSKYLEKHYPSTGDINRWNRLVKLESTEKYVALAKASVRQSEFAKVADSVRAVDSGGRVRRPVGNGKVVREQEGMTSIHPELAVMYYREAIGDDIKNAEFELLKVRDELVKSEALNRSKYLEIAEVKLQEIIDSGELRSLFVGSGEVSDAEFDEGKTSLSDPKVLEMLAGKLMTHAVDEKLQTLVYQKFQEGGLEGQSKGIWEKIKDVEGIFDEHWWQENLSDRNSEFAWNLVKEAIVMGISGGLGAWFAAGAKLRWLAVGGLRGAQMIEGGALSNRLYNLGSMTVGMTTAESAIRTAFLGENVSLGTIGKNLGRNLVMFGSIQGGMFLWQKVAGKALVGAPQGAKLFEARTNLEFIESALYRNAGGLGKAGLKAIDLTGKLSTETAVFTGLGVSERLAFDDLKWDDVNLVSEAGRNLLTILALKGGNKIFEPAYKPVLASAEVQARRVIENADHSVFIKNNPVAKDFFAGLAPSAERDAMDKYRDFVDIHGIDAQRVCAGKSRTEIEQIMKRVGEITKGETGNVLSKPPTGEALVKMAKEEPAVFEIIAGKMKKLPLTLDQAIEIAKNDPVFISKFYKKFPFSVHLDSVKSDFLAMSQMIGGSKQIDPLTWQNVTKKMQSIFSSLMDAGFSRATSVGLALMTLSSCKAMKQAGGGLKEVAEFGTGPAIPIALLIVGGGLLLGGFIKARSEVKGVLVQQNVLDILTKTMDLDDAIKASNRVVVDGRDTQELPNVAGMTREIESLLKRLTSDIKSCSDTGMRSVIVRFRSEIIEAINALKDGNVNGFNTAYTKASKIIAELPESQFVFLRFSNLSRIVGAILLVLAAFVWAYGAGLLGKTEEEKEEEEKKKEKKKKAAELKAERERKAKEEKDLMEKLLKEEEESKAEKRGDPEVDKEKKVQPKLPQVEIQKEKGKEKEEDVEYEDYK